jgi:hypothetical protein
MSHFEFTRESAGKTAPDPTHDALSQRRLIQNHLCSFSPSQYQKILIILNEISILKLTLTYNFGFVAKHFHLIGWTPNYGTPCI